MNRRNNLFHLMLTRVDGEGSRLDSRFAHSLEQARKAVAYWKTELHVAAEDIHDNSMVNLDSFSWVDVSPSGDLEGMPWRAVVSRLRPDPGRAEQ